MSDHLTPLEVCLALIGPLDHLGRIAGLKPKAGYFWRNSSRNRNAGQLPPRVQAKILMYARGENIPLTADHLIFGASRAEIAALQDNLAVVGADRGREQPAA